MGGAWLDSVLAPHSTLAKANPAPKGSPVDSDRLSLIVWQSPIASALELLGLVFSWR